MFHELPSYAATGRSLLGGGEMGMTPVHKMSGAEAREKVCTEKFARGQVGGAQPSRAGSPPSLGTLDPGAGHPLSGAVLGTVAVEHLSGLHPLDAGMQCRGRETDL